MGGGGGGGVRGSYPFRILPQSWIQRGGVWRDYAPLATSFQFSSYIIIDMYVSLSLNPNSKLPVELV